MAVAVVTIPWVCLRSHSPVDSSFCGCRPLWSLFGLDPAESGTGIAEPSTRACVCDVDTEERYDRAFALARLSGSSHLRPASGKLVVWSNQELDLIESMQGERNVIATCRRTAHANEILQVDRRPI